MNRKNSLRSIDWWSFHSYATSPSTASPEERKLNYGKRVCTPGSATSNGYISRTKHRHRGLPRLSNVLQSSPSFKTIPSSIGSEFLNLKLTKNGTFEGQNQWRRAILSLGAVPPPKRKSGPPPKIEGQGPVVKGRSGQESGERG